MTPARENRKIGGITGVILAGGQNSRFPITKGFITVEGLPIIERNLALMRSLFHEVMISTNMPGAFFYLGAPLLGDVLPSRGPMSGIYTALINSRDSSIFITACDMPFIEAGTIQMVCNKHLKRSRMGPVDATIPVFDGEPQPLFGVYGKPVLPALEEAVMQDKVTLKRFLNDIRVQYIDEPEVRAADPEGRSFININTVEDYKKLIMGNEEELRPVPESRRFISE